MRSDHDVEVLVSGHEPRRPPRTWLRRTGWLVAGGLVAWAAVSQGTGTGTDAVRSPAPAGESHTNAPITKLPAEEVTPYWSVEGEGPGSTSPSPLVSAAKPATLRVQCIGHGVLRVVADTGRAVTVGCPGPYESVRFDVFGTFTRGADRDAGAPVEFEVDASAMDAGAQWRVWMFLTYTPA